MAKFSIGPGIDKYISSLSALTAATPHIIGLAVFEGAKIVTDEVRKGIQGLPVVDTNFRGKERPTMIRGVNKTQKEGLLEGLGIASMRNEGGYWNVKVGEDGYNNVATRGRRQANAMIARSVESGTSFRQKTPFIAPAVNRTKAAAEKKMAEVVDKEIQTIVN